MIVPLGNRVLVKPAKVVDLKTDSGIMLPGNVAAPQSVKFNVVAVGPEVKDFKVGDVVFASQFAPTECRESSVDETLIVPAEDILAIVTSK